MASYSQFGFWLHFKINLFVHLLKSIYLSICLSTGLSDEALSVCCSFRESILSSFSLPLFSFTPPFLHLLVLLFTDMRSNLILTKCQ